MNDDYISVTEIAGDKVSREQVVRLCNRYYWAAEFCKGKDVVEVACGTGQGLGYLHSLANSFEAGDYSAKIVQIAKNHYGDRIKISNFDAQNMPFESNTKDVIVIFEAIYYLPDFQKFLCECKRVLKKNGVILIATANKDLFDFNSSPYSYKYYGVKELSEVLGKHGYDCQFWGDTPVGESSLFQRFLRPVKKTAVALNIIPRSMAAKKILKRIVFGKLVDMPAEITESTSIAVPPNEISSAVPDTKHKVILCAAKLAS